MRKQRQRSRRAEPKATVPVNVEVDELVTVIGLEKVSGGTVVHSYQIPRSIAEQHRTGSTPPNMRAMAISHGSRMLEEMST